MPPGYRGIECPVRGGRFGAITAAARGWVLVAKKQTKKKVVKRTPVKRKATGTRKKATKKAGSASRKKASTAARRPKTEKQITIRTDALKEFERHIGGGKKSIAKANRLADLDSAANPRMFLSSGSLSLDHALTPPWSKIGGIPMGRVTEIFGPAHHGKTTLLDHIFANCQRVGGVGVLIETDTKRDPHYTRAIGVNLDDLEYIEFDSWSEVHMENAMDAVISSIVFWRERAPTIPMVVGVDAIGVTPTKKEIENSVAKGTTASAAKVLRKSCRKIAGVLSGTNSALVVLNHEYTQISFGGGPSSPKSVYGGSAVELLSTVRIRLHPVKDAWIKDSQGVVLGKRVGFSIKKFKLGAAYSEGEFALLSSVGIDNVWSIFDRLVKRQLIVTNGPWSAINLDGEEIKFQGYLSLRNKCLEHPELFAKLVAAYRSTL